MKALLSALLVCSAVAGHAAAQSAATQALQEAESFLRPCEPVLDATGKAECETRRRTFPPAYARAKRGDYEAQRDVATELSFGFSGIRRDGVQACAWWFVLVGSGHAQMNDGDTRSFEMFCGILTDTQRAAATSRGLRIGGEIARAQAEDRPGRTPQRPRQEGR